MPFSGQWGRSAVATIGRITHQTSKPGFAPRNHTKDPQANKIQTGNKKLRKIPLRQAASPELPERPFKSIPVRGRNTCDPCKVAICWLSGSDGVDAVG